MLIPISRTRSRHPPRPPPPQPTMLTFGPAHHILTFHLSSTRTPNLDPIRKILTTIMLGTLFTSPESNNNAPQCLRRLDSVMQIGMGWGWGGVASTAEEPAWRTWSAGGSIRDTGKLAGYRGE
ncbi:hypothetical protein BJ508DRAFT_364801 [Ascobolus immersus RN42]|uniref:Uncharacterized protein n=1 Tax=Ascobolus immersus RN42 TaxID=1160509 RepID=A0A3N4I4Z2_ASCIM|nr:hypothetical protein BJ508DRAFT_364801 [Ascobolus immersus RN42]